MYREFLTLTNIYVIKQDAPVEWNYEKIIAYKCINVKFTVCYYCLPISHFTKGLGTTV